jgi:hydroxyethylthiazole kinase-like uncharacterized protein yjeF
MNLIEAGVYAPSDVREMDRIAIEDVGIPGYTLMTRAGQAAFEDARARFPDARRWLVVCGAGNNAGDGYVIARLARVAGFAVTVAAVSPPEALAGDAARAWADYRDLVGDLAGDPDGTPSGGSVVDFTAARIDDSELIVDALLGTGLGRPLDGDYRRVVEAIARADRPVLSVDVPSGLNSETGEVMGAAVKATLTATFVGLKQGFFLGAGPDQVGELCFHDLGIPSDALRAIKPAMRIFGPDALRDLMPHREATAHKGRFGHVLVVGGNRGMGGAARLAGEAALRSGAGLVSIATRPETVAAVMAYRPELMCRAIETSADLEPLLARATVIALGPGLGQDAWAQDLFARLLDCPQPKVLDADALNLLARTPVRRDDWILTPHPGEAGRLLGRDTADVQSNRLAASGELTRRYGGISILKGRGTLIGAAGAAPYLITAGNPGMATAGMGDVLTGLTAGLLAQFPDQPHASAAAAAYAHAAAGDQAAESGQRGLIATDLFSVLRPLLNDPGANNRRPHD